MADSNATTVRISKKTRLVLSEVGKEIGMFGDTFDDIIIKLAEHYKKCRHKNGEK